MYQVDIVQWHGNVRVKSMAHLIAAQQYELLYNIIGFLAIFAGLFAGYEVIQTDATPPSPWTIALGAFAIIAAVSNAAMKFFGFENRKQLHHSAATQYASIQYEIECSLMTSDKQIPEEFYQRIAKQLSEIDKNSPLVARKVSEKAKRKVGEQSSNEIPIYYAYDIKLSEVCVIDDDKFKEIGEEPVRSYECEALEMNEYRLSNKITIKNKLIMKRDGIDHSNILKGEGIVDNNIAFINYSIHNYSNGNTTYGTMVISFTNRVQAKGYWVTAGVKGANFLIGKLEMNLISSQNKDTA